MLTFAQVRNRITKITDSLLPDSKKLRDLLHGLIDNMQDPTDPALGIGYAAGAGGSVAQGTSKTTAVTINKVTGRITMFATGAINLASTATFTVNNTAVLANDNIVVNHITGGTAGAYIAFAHSPVAGTSFKITVYNITAGNLTEAPILQYSLHRAAVA